ncbi:class I SAM-dependent methyltransferase [Candidatus Hecatella orcuttiae]|jgi:ubiquinone/menaquinone biosynthesis C-methylase UbiE|uniref:class I SAM-dependent methyltransferase n=1 Tax=Candidatus Hecatella orcuttiae TaxID=1935119 RepID=UPI0028682967|nr:class I SAM-dependent methyltransferase [Candidatus Hecatella orcuttiae]
MVTKGIIPRKYYKEYQSMEGQNKLYEAEGHLRRREKVLEVVHKFAEGDILLDVGCAEGCYLKLFRDLFNFLIGLDISLPLLRKAGKNDKTDYIHGVGETLPLKNSSVNLILCSQVLEHVINPSAILSEMKRVLKPDGLLVLTVPVPYKSEFWSKIRRKFFVLRRIRVAFIADKKHLRSFSPKEILSLMEENGFSVIESFFSIKVLRVDFPFARTFYSKILKRKICEDISNSVLVCRRTA